MAKVRWKLFGPDWSYLHPSKLELIDSAFRDHGCRSFADLGGVWHVDGGYSFYTLHNYPVTGVLVDAQRTPALDAQTQSAPRLQIVTGDFTDPALAAALPPVDAVFHFDTLLHQFDWRTPLDLYRPHAHLICQPNWTGPTSVALTDLPEDDYLRVVMAPGEKPDPRLLTDLRDSTAIFRWGITDADLEQEMRARGYRLVFRRDWGPFREMEMFNRRAFLFLNENAEAARATTTT